MILYELAKQLKDAGFKQMGNGGSLMDKTCPHQGVKHNGGRCLAYSPTLEELIEACGERFGNLAREEYYNDGSLKHVRWVAYSDESSRDTGFGSSPEEAVANLWLELNKHA